MSRRTTSIRAGLLTSLVCFTVPGSARAQVVVFAPHPDDEALMASGIFNRARTTGETVKVVIATNGDCEAPAIAQQRQQESLAAMAILGRDRINLDDQIIAGILRFSDGTTVAVGPLPNDGAPLQSDFASRTVTWVRLEITDARGWSTGPRGIRSLLSAPSRYS